MISLEWVSDYIDLKDQDLKELAVKITGAGINVEKVITNHIDNLVIGKVLTCVNHEDSDHLHVCQVEINDNIKTQIVCGAPNVKEGIKVIVALPGAILPGDFTIKKSKIRGVESNGMICALFELGLEEKTEENYNKGIHILPNEAPVGEDPIHYLNLDDTLYELDIHKHRNNDCYYHIGFAYEIACILNRKVTLPCREFKTINDNILNHVKLKVETDKCPYYLAKMVTDIKIKESPEFIKRRLLAAGMRPINNVVDISNYVMLEYGQPLHFFDKDKLGKQILVRNAVDNETIVTLDNKERVLTKNDIVITDGVKPVCLAGVMGGENTDVDENTKTILIESAIFDAVSIRYTASNLNLKSEASIRYAKGLNYEYTNQAIERACHLLEKYADAKVLDGMLKHDVIDKTPKVVTFKPEEVDKMLGIEIKEKDMEKELQRLDFDYEIKDGVFKVTIPNRRLDIDPNVNDIAEEIGRLYGYQNLVSTLPKTPIRRGKYVGMVKYRKMLSKRLRGLGLTETKTYTLVSKNQANLFKSSKELIVLPNPLSADKAVVRTSLIPSLLQVVDYNKARGIDDISIYEISNTYADKNEEDLKLGIVLHGKYINTGWQNKSIDSDFYVLKGITENILNYMGLKNRYSFICNDNLPKELHPKISSAITVDGKTIGYLGQVHPKLRHDCCLVLELSLTSLINHKVGKLQFVEASKYPESHFDMAFVVKNYVTCGQIMDTIKKSAGKMLKNIDVFDIYTGDKLNQDEKSLAFSLTLGVLDHTLTGDEIDTITSKIIKDVENKHQAKLRNE